MEDAGGVFRSQACTRLSVDGELDEGGQNCMAASTVTSRRWHQGAAGGGTRELQPADTNTTSQIQPLLGQRKRRPLTNIDGVEAFTLAVVIYCTVCRTRMTGVLETSAVLKIR